MAKMIYRKENKLLENQIILNRTSLNEKLKINKKVRKGRNDKKKEEISYLNEDLTWLDMEFST